MLKELLMTLGPVQMEQHILELGAKQVSYPRTPEYSSWYADINTGLQYIFQTQRPVFTITCSGTGVMQMAADNLCVSGDPVLTFATGVFGKRWGEILRTLGANVIETPIEEGKNITPEILQSVLEKHPEAKMVFTTYNETSTTALADVQGCANLLRSTDKLLVVDAVSALLVEPLQMDAWGVDVVLTSSQKALALPPGLGFIAFSEKAWAKVTSHSCRSLYFDAKAYAREWSRNQLPYTASLNVVIQLKQRLTDIRKEGLQALQAKSAQLTQRLRNGLQKLGFTFLSSNMGNCTTAVHVPVDIDAQIFVDKMRLEQKVTVGSPYPGKDVIRVGNFGNITEDDIDSCLERFATVLQELRMEKGK